MFSHLLEARCVTLWWKPAQKPTVSPIIDLRVLRHHHRVPVTKVTAWNILPRRKASPFWIQRICIWSASFANFIQLSIHFFRAVSPALWGSGVSAGAQEEGSFAVTGRRCELHNTKPQSGTRKAPGCEAPVKSSPPPPPPSSSIYVWLISVSWFHKILHRSGAAPAWLSLAGSSSDLSACHPPLTPTTTGFLISRHSGNTARLRWLVRFFTVFTAPGSDRRDTWLAAVIRRRLRRSLPYLQSAVSETESRRKERETNNNRQLRDHRVSHCKLNWKRSFSRSGARFGGQRRPFLSVSRNKRLNKQTNGGQQCFGAAAAAAAATTATPSGSSLPAGNFWKWTRH